MAKFEVILNRCTDQDYENEITCDCCRRKGSVAIILGRRICTVCLTLAQVEVSRAIYNAIGGNAYVPSKDSDLSDRT